MAPSTDKTKTATMADIDREQARLRRLLRDADPAALDRRLPNGAWSILENVRHLLFAEQLHLGGVVTKKVQFSPLGMTGMRAQRFALVGSAQAPSLEDVLGEWAVIHRATRNALRSASGPEVDKALWGNHRHLRIHREVIERLLRHAAQS